MTALDLARIQFASTSIYHFFFVPVTIGLAFLVAILHTAWFRSGNPEHRRLTRFFGTLLVINVAVGVVTGLVQEFEFGMNWSEYSRFVGDVFGAPLAMEGLAAFFLESTFLGLWLFGWNVLPRARAPGHRLAGRARLGRCRRRSSWPRTRGCSTRSATRRTRRPGGRELTSIGAVLTNPVFVWGYLHVLLASAGHRRVGDAGGLGVAPAAHGGRRAVPPLGEAVAGRAAARHPAQPRGRQPAGRHRGHVPADEDRRGGGAVDHVPAVLVLGLPDRRRQPATRRRRRSSRSRTCSRSSPPGPGTARSRG